MIRMAYLDDIKLRNRLKKAYLGSIKAWQKKWMIRRLLLSWIFSYVLMCCGRLSAGGLGWRCCRQGCMACVVSGTDARSKCRAKLV